MSKAQSPQKKLGDDIAFGMQQTLACMATDFIEAPINTRIQWALDKKDVKSTDLQNLGGEVMGSVGSLIAFLGLRQVFPSLFDWMKKVSATALDGFFEKSGRESLKKWAHKNHVAENSPEYREKMAEWKDFQADNFAKSSFLHVGNVAFNVVGQKTLTKNPHSWWVLTASKLVSGLITPVAVLGFRLIAPKTAKELDKELSERYFTPLVYKTQKLVGAETKDREEFAVMHPPGQLDVEKKDKKPKHKDKHAERVREEGEETALNLR